MIKKRKNVRTQPIPMAIATDLNSYTISICIICIVIIALSSLVAYGVVKNKQLQATLKQQKQVLELRDVKSKSLEDLKKQHSILEKEVKALQNEIEKTKQDITVNETSEKLLNATIETNNANLKTLEMEFQQIRGTIETLSAQKTQTMLDDVANNVQVQSSLSEVEKNIKELQTSHHEKMNNLRIELTVKKNRTGALRNQLAELENEKRGIETTKQEHMKSIALFNAKIVEHQKNIQRSETNRNSKQQTVENLKIKLDELQSAEVLINQMIIKTGEKIQSMKYDIQDKQIKITERNEFEASMKAESEKLKVDIELKRQTLSKEETQLQNKNAQVELVLTQKKTLVERREILVFETRQIEGELKSLETSSKLMNETKTRMQNENRTKSQQLTSSNEAEFSKLEKNIANNKEAIVKASARFKQASENTQTTLDKIKLCDVVKNELELEIYKYQQRKLELSRDIELLTSKKDDTVNRETMVQSEIQDLTNQNERTSKKLAQNVERLENMKTEIRILEKRIHECQEKKQADRSTEAEIAKVQLKIDDTLQAIQTKEAEIEKLEAFCVICASREIDDDPFVIFHSANDSQGRAIIDHKVHGTCGRKYILYHFAKEQLQCPACKGNVPAGQLLYETFNAGQPKINDEVLLNEVLKYILQQKITTGTIPTMSAKGLISWLAMNVKDDDIANVWKILPQRDRLWNMFTDSFPHISVDATATPQPPIKENKVSSLEPHKFDRDTNESEMEIHTGMRVVRLY